MDFGGFILLLVVVFCVISLIRTSKKRKALESSISSTKHTTDLSATIDSASGKVEEKPANPLQNTIYAFSSKRANCPCPFCEGENSPGAKTCTICGRDLP